MGITIPNSVTNNEVPQHENKRQKKAIEKDIKKLLNERVRMILKNKFRKQLLERYKREQ